MIRPAARRGIAFGFRQGLAILIFRMRPPVPAYGFVILRACTTGMSGFALLSLPVATDLDVLRAASILGGGLIRLRGRLLALNRS